MRRAIQVGLCLLFTACGAATAQEEIINRFSGGQFTDALLTVTVGDTVTWVYDGGPGGPHHVVSAGQYEGLFNSGPPSLNAFQFIWTFDAPGFYEYQCTTHQPAERGWVSVGLEANESAFVIDSRMAGAWLDPLTPGQGIMVDVQDTALFVAWFTYEEGATKIGAREHRWLTAQGEYRDDAAILVLFETSGGRFNAGDPVSTVAVGDLTLRLDSCNHAWMHYRFDDGPVGDIALDRLVPSADCE